MREKILFIGRLSAMVTRNNKHSACELVGRCVIRRCEYIGGESEKY